MIIMGSDEPWNFGFPMRRTRMPNFRLAVLHQEQQLLLELVGGHAVVGGDHDVAGHHGAATPVAGAVLDALDGCAVRQEGFKNAALDDLGGCGRHTLVVHGVAADQRVVSARLQRRVIRDAQEARQDASTDLVLQRLSLSFADRKLAMFADRRSWACAPPAARAPAPARTARLPPGPRTGPARCSAPAAERRAAGPGARPSRGWPRSAPRGPEGPPCRGRRPRRSRSRAARPRPVSPAVASRPTLCRTRVKLLPSLLRKRVRDVLARSSTFEVKMLSISRN